MLSTALLLCLLSPYAMADGLPLEAVVASWLSTARGKAANKIVTPPTRSADDDDETNNSAALDYVASVLKACQLGWCETRDTLEDIKKQVWWVQTPQLRCSNSAESVSYRRLSQLYSCAHRHAPGSTVFTCATSPPDRESESSAVVGVG